MIKHAVVLALAGFLGAGYLFAATTVNVSLKDSKGQDVGTAKISEVPKGGVTILLNVKGLPPGDHAAHIHQVAKCDGPAFTTAGGHFNPEMKKHGLDNPDGPHAGDMNNFTVGAKGKAKQMLVNTRVNLGAGDHSLFANGGTALMIHEKADDYKTDPTGSAGNRIACGTITK
ncbi:MAG TPA: superoxide dismutase family protein [Bryobacteraceae bacterium]|nr:superoxide dismutase family protein [Bryobacteraceae bacterium]